MANLKQFNRAFFSDLWKLIKPYWSESEERWSARLLIALVIALNLLMVFISYRITEWYNTFWNALQGYNAPAAWHQLLIFVVLATPYVVAAVYQSYLASMLMIRWRRWLTNRYLDAWLARGTYYHMQLLGDGTDNPDQRISEDLSSFTSQTLNLAIGLLSSLTTLVAFIAMLWKLSSQVALPWHGGTVAIPGYLVWVAIIYSAIGTVIVALVGRPLIRMRFDQERFNADFRFSLVRLRENSESVALYGGESREHAHFLANFASVFQNYWQIMRRSKRLNWWTNGYGQAAVIFPVLVSLPAYFAKVIQIGTILQISSAFGQVQGALSYIVNSYPDLATWHAVVDRLRFFQQAMDRARDIQDDAPEDHPRRRTAPRCQEPLREPARRPRAHPRPEHGAESGRAHAHHGTLGQRQDHHDALAGRHLAVRGRGGGIAPGRQRSLSAPEAVPAPGQPPGGAALSSRRSCHER